MASCSDWAQGMLWTGVYRAGPMGRKILGNCEKHAAKLTAAAEKSEKPDAKARSQPKS